MASKGTLAARVFILSEAFFFFALIAAFVIFAFQTEGAGAVARDSLDAVKTGIYTVLLILSSLTVWVAEHQLRKGSHRGALVALAVTVLLGAVFLTGQAIEYRDLLSEGITVNSSLFATSFFTLTGFHGLHVALGLIALVITAILVRLKKAGAEAGLGAVSLYWHFVDVVWILVFVLVYLR